MAERRSFWRRIFGGEGDSSLSQRQQKVQRYIIHRIEEGASLQEVLREEYVRRSCSREELDEIVRSPELVAAARARLGESFRSDELRF